ncbi:hypothetical protein BMG03_00900 [Thioclava nitratireducens]|uniref:Uncharacterized protein n=1 Tax=Thioclava nitratireducens TaxID=1915078 RepID=A0ABN4XAT9_9RHOB|nr:hypothetical protein [Thioclava nitratireducens]AQS46513.1 hypothetical protein BMG03_00900 [Thioclava nitratireducens]
MPSNTLFKSAHLKLDWASKHIDEIERTLSEKRPFRYFIESNADTCERCAYAERDEDIVDELSLRCGDAVHNLRSAIDHAYSAVVLPVAETPGQKINVQFPVSNKADRYEGQVKSRLAHKVSREFYDAIVEMQAHGGDGGNELLYAIHTLDVPDKHTRLIPVGYFVKVHIGAMRKIAPDFMVPLPPSSMISVGQNRRDFSWTWQWLKAQNRKRRRAYRPRVQREEIDIPVEVSFEVRQGQRTLLAVPTLHRFANVARDVVSTISKFS